MLHSRKNFYKIFIDLQEVKGPSAKQMIKDRFAWLH